MPFRTLSTFGAPSETMPEPRTAEDVLAAIDAAYDAEDPRRPGSSIGASIVGNPCDAVLDLQLRGFPDVPIDPQLKRIFGLGHKIEDMVVRDLKKAGIRIWEKDHATGRQWYYSDLGEHVKCYADGHVELADGLALLEIKSINLARFDELRQIGVKLAHPTYFAQCQLAMGLSGFERVLFVAYCKNNSRYHAEIVTHDPFEVAMLVARIERVFEGRVHKIAHDESDWRCRGCFKRGVCWGDQEVPRTCQTCRHALPARDGTWNCTLHGRQAKEPCGDYALHHPKPREHP